MKEKGLKDYNRIVLNRFKGRIADYVQIKTVDIRIRKASGEIKDYNVRDLPTPEITEEDDYFDSKDDLFIYDIPDLAVGDELELVTVIESKFLDNGRIVNLYKSYPILNASFTISVPLKVQLKGDIYNGMPGTQGIEQFYQSNLQMGNDQSKGGYRKQTLKEPFFQKIWSILYMSLILMLSDKTNSCLK